MDFTPPPNPPPIQPQPIPNRKLPIKRSKTPSSTLIPFPAPDHDADAAGDAVLRHPPFKFHRIWTEPDEIRLLQGLLDCSTQGLSFPRDLGIFYAQFADGMSQPYSKSQLTEKLRRLRKKFRVISTRLSKGLDKSLLSPQDRALFDLSKQLWEPDRPALPSGGTNLNPKPAHSDASNSDGIKVKVRVRAMDEDVDVDVDGVKVRDRDRDSLSPSLPSSPTAVLALPAVVRKPNNRDTGDKINKFDDDFNLNVRDAGNVNVELERNVKLAPNEVKVKSFGDDLSSGIVRFATITLAEVLDQSLKEMRMMIDLQRCSNLEKEISFEKRWRD